VAKRALPLRLARSMPAYMRFEKTRLVWFWRASLLFLILCWASCRVSSPPASTAAANMPKRDINLVLRDHDKELMAIPGVVGVFVGALGDGKTPCLKVMAERKTPELKRKIPKSLEGYAVVLEETGPIRPLGK
jgi:hypothetical protein